MPIITFEYSSNLTIDKKIRTFLLETHQILVDEIKTDLRTCRSTILKCENYVIADDDPKNAFIVLSIRMLPGRTEETKNRLGEIVLQKIHRDFSETIAKFDTQIRVALTETDKNHYYGLEK
jgi:5-carboxymethyl-2-hydroxymuconate isomerase